MTRLSRSLSTLIVIAMMLTVTAVPALAVAVGSASITSDDLLSGQGGSFTVRISNDGVGGGSVPLVGGDGDGDINAFVIEVPGSVFSATSAQLPEGWEGGYDSDIGFVFANATSDDFALEPGSKFDVKVTGTAAAIPDDRSANVPVFVSDDYGMTLSSAGTPALVSRILRLDEVTVVKPGAVNPDPTQVTEDQTTADVRVSVTNFGTQSRSVTLDAAKASGSSDVTVSDAPAVSVPAGGSGTVTADAVFGTAGSLVIEATATSANSEAQPLASADIAVQDAFAATYVAESLAPSTVLQGDSVVFELQVNKTGVQPASLTSTFSSADIGLSTTGTTGFPADSDTTLVQFPAVTIPNEASATYDTSATFSGVDHNGADVDVTITPDSLTLDDLIPYVEVDVDLPPTMVAGATEAASSDTTIDITGYVGNDEGQGASSDPCGDCVIEAKLQIFSTLDGTGSPIAVRDFDLANNNGDLSASRSFDFPDNALSARVRVKATKGNEKFAVDLSDVFEVDVIDPVLVSAVTGRDETGDLINVFISELVNAAGVSPLDFEVDDNSVTAVNALPQTDGATLFELRLARPFEDDNATPAVNYRPGTALSQRPTDRVGKPVADKLLETIDGIVPEAPVIQTVNGLALQDDAYWTNVTNPTVTLTGMVPGDTLFLYFETDGDGIPENGEQIFSGAVSSDTETITLDAGALPGSDTNGTLIARMFDAVGFGELDSDALNVDFTPPTIESFVQDGNTVTVNFNEPLARGRDAAFDWTVTAVQDGTTASRTVTAVSGTGDSRVLSVSTSSYDPARGDVTGVRFKYRGPSTMRYDDRATNPFLDQTSSVLG